MVTVSLTSGDHTIAWSMNGYESLQAVITVHITGAVACKSSTSGTCNTSTPPGIYASGSEIVGYLIKTEVTPPTTFEDWVIEKGGISAIEANLMIMGEFIDGYFEIVDIGFTPTLLNMGTFIEYECCMSYVNRFIYYVIQ